MGEREAGNGGLYPGELCLVSHLPTDHSTLWTTCPSAALHLHLGNTGHTLLTHKNVGGSKAAQVTSNPRAEISSTGHGVGRFVA